MVNGESVVLLCRSESVALLPSAGCVISTSSSIALQGDAVAE
jgi:hypothetical protein